mmetsp:Transcript_3126/g.4944  ORF Transcript_3126/g.4944 Transcript_3126/m.4944 type:complete len:126 (-) Transcript_3126:671-1048(-)
MYGSFWSYMYECMGCVRVVALGHLDTQNGLVSKLLTGLQQVHVLCIIILDSFPASFRPRTPHCIILWGPGGFVTLDKTSDLLFPTRALDKPSFMEQVKNSTPFVFCILPEKVQTLHNDESVSLLE